MPKLQGAKKRMRNQRGRAGSRKRARHNPYPGGKKGKRGGKELASDPLLRLAGSDEEITSEDEPEQAPQTKRRPQPDSDEEPEEDARIRLAKQILKELQEEGELDDAADELEADYVQKKLIDEVLKSKDRGFTSHAPRVKSAIDAGGRARVVKGHRNAASCVAVHPESPVAFTGSICGQIVAWDLETGKVLRRRAHGKGAVYGLAVSMDGKFLASGGKDKSIRLWSPDTLEPIHVFKRAHRKAVTCLAFSSKSNILFSGSDDRHVTVWDCDHFAKLHNIIGHASRVTSLHALSKDIAVSSGEDATVRFWDIAHDKQKIFRRYKSSVDSAAFINRREFVSGSQGGQLSLWTCNRRKPTYSLPDAHGTGNWLSSVAAIPYSDVIASGSSDGRVRFFSKHAEELRALGEISGMRTGWINQLAFTKDGRFLVGATGRDHRHGRWQTMKGARDGILIVDLSAPAQEPNASGAEPKKGEVDGFLAEEEGASPSNDDEP